MKKIAAIAVLALSACGPVVPSGEYKMVAKVLDIKCEHLFKKEFDVRLVVTSDGRHYTVVMSEALEDPIVMTGIDGKNGISVLDTELRQGCRYTDRAVLTVEDGPLYGNLKKSISCGEDYCYASYSLQVTE